MWLFYVSCAWVAGIFLGSKVSFPLIGLAFGLIPFALIPFLPGSKKALITAGVCLLALISGALRFTSSLPAADEHSLCFYNDKGVLEIRGIVAEVPDIRDNYCQLTFSASEIVVSGEKKAVSGTALIRMPRYPIYHYGDMLRVTGELETPKPFDHFDYKTYLARQGIYSVIYYPRVEVLEHGKGLKPLQWIYSLREKLSLSLSRALPEPQGSLAQAILLGLRGNIPDSVHKAFSRAGTAHLLAISGMHMGIVIAMLVSLGISIFGRRHYLYVWLAVVGTWLYALLAGMNPPVIRAAIMGSLFLLAEFLGRQRSAIIALAFAAAVMVGIQPALLWTVSFQLTFLAMAGLVFFYPYLQAWGRKKTSTLLGERATLVHLGNLVTDSFAASLAAIMTTAPLIAYNFGIISLVGLPATFFSLPALPPIIVTAALVAFIGLLAPLLAQILGWLAWLFLTYLLLVVQGFDALPFSSFQATSVPAWHIWGYYGVLAGVVACLNNKTQMTGFLSRIALRVREATALISVPLPRFSLKWFLPPLLLVVILIWTAVATLPDDKLYVSFLDVGQGDAILIQTPNAQNILIDGGPDPQKINLELSKKLPFWDRTIELVICTQPQADHITGLIEVVQRYKVKRLLSPGIPYDTALYQAWLRLIEGKAIECTAVHAGEAIDLGEAIKIEVLNPPATLYQGTSDDVDNNGLVLRLSWGEVSFLFTADIREETEFELIAQGANLRSTVLKVAHHGSKTSTTAQFLAAVDPEVAVISVGLDNPFGHPSSQVVQRLFEKLGKENVYRTDEHGTIEFITDGERLWVKRRT